VGTKWDQLLDLYIDIDEDPKWNHLRTPGIRLVKGDGRDTAERAQVLIVGEAPGANENGQGRPFVGASGRVLNDLLGAARLDRSKVFITNVVKYRPPGNRTPSTLEGLNGQEELRREWSILRPTLTIAVGATAHWVLRGSLLSLSSTPHGEFALFGSGHEYSYITSMYHPAFGLRNEKMRPRIEEEWIRLGEMIDEACPEVRDV
jgi:uracil-DNA glycosylase